jgi:hypothetical protein
MSRDSLLHPSIRSTSTTVLRVFSKTYALSCAGQKSSSFRRHAYTEQGRMAHAESDQESSLMNEPTPSTNP